MYFYKIGVTNATIKRRYDAETNIVYTVLYEQYHQDGLIPLNKEQKIKEKYRKYLVSKNINVFDRTGNTEVFYIDVLNLDKRIINGTNNRK